MLFQLLGFLLLSTNIATVIILDTDTDAKEDGGWSTVNCTYENIYSDLNKLQCKMKNVSGTEMREPGMNLTGFWTPCQDDWCEVAYTFNGSTASSHSVSIKGYLEGNASIGVQVERRNDSGNMTEFLGNLPNTNQWTEASFQLGNVTEDSILKVIITQNEDSDSVAILDRITIGPPKMSGTLDRNVSEESIGFVSMSTQDMDNRGSDAGTSDFSNHTKAPNPTVATPMKKSDSKTKLPVNLAIASNETAMNSSESKGISTTSLPVTQVTLRMFIKGKIMDPPMVFKMAASSTTTTAPALTNSTTTTAHALTNSKTTTAPALANSTTTIAPATANSTTTTAPASTNSTTTTAPAMTNSTTTTAPATTNSTTTTAPTQKVTLNNTLPANSKGTQVSYVKPNSTDFFKDSSVTSESISTGLVDAQPMKIVTDNITAAMDEVISTAHGPTVVTKLDAAEPKPLIISAITKVLENITESAFIAGMNYSVTTEPKNSSSEMLSGPNTTKAFSMIANSMNSSSEILNMTTMVNFGNMSVKYEEESEPNLVTSEAPTSASQEETPENTGSESSGASDGVAGPISDVNEGNAVTSEAGATGETSGPTEGDSSVSDLNSGSTEATLLVSGGNPGTTVQVSEPAEGNPLASDENSGATIENSGATEGNPLASDGDSGGDATESSGATGDNAGATEGNSLASDGDSGGEATEGGGATAENTGVTENSEAAGENTGATEENSGNSGASDGEGQTRSDSGTSETSAGGGEESTTNSPPSVSTGSTKRDSPVTQAQYGSGRSAQGSTASLALYIGVPAAVLFLISITVLLVYMKKKRSVMVTP